MLAQAQTQSRGSIAGTVRDFQGAPWPDLALWFYVFNGDAANFAAAERQTGPLWDIQVGSEFANRGLGEGATRTGDTGRYRFELSAGVHMMALQQEGTSFGIIVFPVFAGVVTPGNINCKTSAHDVQALETHLAAGENELAGVRKLRDKMNQEPLEQRPALQARLNAAVARTKGEFQAALAATDEADSFFERWTVLTKIAETDDVAERYAEAEKVYEQAVALKPDAAVYNNRLRTSRGPAT